jgi:hypothetical protein
VKLDRASIAWLLILALAWPLLVWLLSSLRSLMCGSPPFFR